MEEIIALHPATRDDLESILSVQRLSAEAGAWEAADYVSALEDKGAVCLVAEDRLWERLAGFLVARIVADEMEILNLAVDPGYRRRGIARRLLGEVLARAERQGAKQCWLEVRASNGAALGFYRALGFTESHRRWRYYRDPVEDAVVCRRLLPTAGPAP